MINVGDYFSKGENSLSSEEIKKCIGNNKGLNNVYTSGKFDCVLSLGDVLGEVCFPGRGLGKLPFCLENLLNEITDSFELFEDDRYYFMITDFEDCIYVESPSGELFRVRKDGYALEIPDWVQFKGDKVMLENRLMTFISWCLKAKVPLYKIAIYPISNSCFSREYLLSKGTCYLGFREAVFHDGMKGDFQMLCGYNEVPEEYVMLILI